MSNEQETKLVMDIIDRLKHLERRIGDAYGAEVVGRASEAMTQQQAKINWLQAIVDKLPTTADGTSVVPEMQVWPDSFGDEPVLHRVHSVTKDSAYIVQVENPERDDWAFCKSLFETAAEAKGE